MFFSPIVLWIVVLKPKWYNCRETTVAASTKSETKTDTKTETIGGTKGPSNELFKKNKEILEKIVNLKEPKAYPMAAFFIKDEFFMIFTTLHLYRTKDSLMSQAINDIKLKLHPMLLKDLRVHEDFVNAVCPISFEKCNYAERKILMFQVANPKVEYYIGVVSGLRGDKNRVLDVFSLRDFSVADLQPPIKYSEREGVHIYLKFDDDISFLSLLFRHKLTFRVEGPVERSVELRVPESKDVIWVDGYHAELVNGTQYMYFGFEKAEYQIVTFWPENKFFKFHNLVGQQPVQDNVQFDNEGRILRVYEDKSLTGEYKQSVYYYLYDIWDPQLTLKIDQVFTVAQDQEQVEMPNDTVFDNSNEEEIMGNFSEGVLLTIFFLYALCLVLGLVFWAVTQQIGKTRNKVVRHAKRDPVVTVVSVPATRHSVSPNKQKKKAR